MPYADVHTMVTACEGVYSLGKLRAGQPYIVHENENGFARFEYEIDGDQRLIVTREDGNFAASLEKIEYEIRLERIEAEIDSSLFLTMSKLGESATLAVRIADIFAWEINFIRDVQPGDSFALLVEKRYRDGEFSGYGKLLAAEFINQQSKYEAYSFPDADGVSMYYNAAGDSVKRAFLKAPLSFTRISSQFNLKRVHPIFKEVRPHPAIDYAAPAGTPVKAIGNGVVTFRGWGKGAGNYIVLRHFNGYESMYLHLQGFAKGLAKGGKVQQGDVIGYVGSTGYSTGPHLDFRMKQNGKYVNPNALMTPRAEPVDKKNIATFKAQRDEYREYMTGRKDLAEYSTEKEM
jgi:murein DD-endopeptidase MepM/ murein hydrolase activator NlpD